MRLLLASMMALAAASAPVAAQTPAVEACKAITTDAARLRCFDEVFREVKPVADTPGVTTREALATAPTTFRVVDPLDFVVAPRKFLNTGVQLRRVQCFHADADDFRCFTTTGDTVTIFAKAIKPATEQALIEERCGSARTAVQSPSCRRSIRFVPTFAEKEQLNALADRLVVRAESVEVIPATQQRR
jgi:hypothetical protein